MKIIDQSKNRKSQIRNTRANTFARIAKTRPEINIFLSTIVVLTKQALRRSERGWSSRGAQNHRKYLFPDNSVNCYCRPEQFLLSSWNTDVSHYFVMTTSDSRVRRTSVYRARRYKRAPKQILSRQTESRPKRRGNRSINPPKGKHGFTGVLASNDPDLREKIFSGRVVWRHTVLAGHCNRRRWKSGRFRFEVISEAPFVLICNDFL